MLTAEFIPHWLPSKLIAGDGELRRLEIGHGGVFWHGRPAGGLPNDKKFAAQFLPWNWPKITEWQCWAVTDGRAERRQDLDVKVEHQEAPSEEGDVATALKRVYEQRIEAEKTRSGLAATVCLPNGPQGGLEIVEEGMPKEEYSGWLRGFVAQKAQSLAPYNITLRLAWLTRALEKPTDAEKLAWLPIFESASEWATAPEQVVWDAATSSVRAVYRAHGETGTELRVHARRADDVAGNTPAAIMRYHAENNFEPLRLGPNMSVTTTDEWLSKLSHRAAVAFDLPRWLVGWLQSLVAERDAPLLTLAQSGTAAQKQDIAKFLQACRQYLVGASRDVTGFGRLRGPDGRCVVEAVWRRAVKDGLWFVPGTPPKFEKAVTDDAKSASLEAFEQAVELADETYDWATWEGVIGEVADELQLKGPVETWKDPAEISEGVVKEISEGVVKEFVAGAAAFLEFMREPEHVRRLVRAQYAALGWGGDDLLRWVDQVLAELPEPARDQAEGLLEHYWQEILAAGTGGDLSDEESRLKQIAQALLLSIVKDCDDRECGAWKARFTGAPALFPGGLINPFAGASGAPEPLTWSAFVAHIKQGFGVAARFPEREQQAPATVARRPETVAELLFPHDNEVYPAAPPVCVAVDQPAAGGGDATDDLNDVIAGVLLFCREVDGQWRALNAARLDVEGNKGAPGELLIASPVGEQGGVRAAYRRFDNENLSIIVSPREHEAPDDEEKPAPDDVPDGLSIGLPDGHKAQCLHYGHTYAIAGALMTNAGVLPPSLRERPDDPAYLAVPRLNGWTGLEGTLGEKRFEYRRRVPVGPVRLKESAPLAALPTSAVRAASDGAGRRAIRPLACELPGWAPSPSKDGETLPSQRLVLLFPEKRPSGITGGHFGSVSFDVVKPSTGFWNWFAWQDDWQKVSVDTRAAEWSAEVARRQQRDSLDSLDDPAVAEMLLCEVQQLFPNEGTIARHYVTYREGTSTLAARSSRSGSIAVTIEVSRGSTVEVPKATNGELTVQIPEGRVVRLTLRSLVAKAAFERRFHACMQQLPRTTLVKREGTTEEYYAVAPVEVWIEAAAEWKPTKGRREELWRALKVEAVGDEGKRRLSARMDYDGAGWLSQVGRLEVRHQVWRWDGREVDRAVLERMLKEEPDNRDVRDSASQIWDGATFATRPDYAHRSSNASLSASLGAVSQEVFVDDLRDDLRCGYHRFAVQAFSRYETVYGEGALGTSEAVQSVATPWRRALIKAARTEPLPKPAVRFALPLTRDVAEESSGGRAAASLMLVLDDVWFAEAGLADDLEVGVRVLTDPAGKGRFVNAGFDPTLTATALGPRPDIRGDVLSLEESLLGPYGLTRDFAAKMPKLSGSAFILRVPVDTLIKEGVAPPWIMCEIAARRVLRSTAAAMSEEVAKERASEWSARMWVQFLPNTEMLLPRAWRGSDGAARSLKIRTSDAGTSFEVAELPLFDAPFEELHERWIVLSERITDIKGHPAEKYLATFVGERSTNGDGFVLRDGDVEPTKEAPRSGYVRLLLVRRRAGAEEPKNARLWDRLFREGPDCNDARTADGVADEGVKNDASHGAPIVTGRVPVTF